MTVLLEAATPGSGMRKTRALSLNARDQIIKLIHSQRLTPGDQLPSEDELSRMLEVSRATVREALVLLESQRIVERRHGRGTFVGVIEDKDFDDLVEYRHMIEAHSGTRLIRRGITASELAEWEAVLDRTKDAKSLEQYSRVQFDFHLHMVALAGNRFVERQFLSLMDRLEMVYFFGSGAKDPEENYAEHRALISCVADGDLPRFLSQIYFHIFSASDIIKECGIGRTNERVVRPF